MKKIIRLFAIASLVFLVSVGVHADDPAPAKPESAKEEFKKLQKEFNDINAELRILQVEYRKAKKEDQPDLEKQWKEVYRRGEEMQTKYFAAAEKAFAEAPNADPEITKLLWKVFGYQVSRDDYENAARVGKLLADNIGNDLQKAEGHIFALAGVAAVAMSEFKSAAVYLDKAKKAGMLRNPPDPKDKQMANFFAFSNDFAALEKKWEDEQKIREAEAKADDLPRVLISTEKGDITVELFENEAPNTVVNFISLVEKKYYDGTPFHRVLVGFMAQGGDPTGTGSGGPGYTIPCECHQPNARNHFRGSLSMAHAGRDTGGSQFFLCFLPTSFLDGKHTVFGRVISGFDVLAKIQRRDPEDPNMADPDKILEMKVLRKRDHEYQVKKTGE